MLSIAVMFIFIQSNSSDNLLYQRLMQNQENKNLSVLNFKACMVLAGVGDAMGYKNGDWQFLTSSTIIHKQMLEMTKNKGPLALKIDMSWKYSDDTVMHIATALALLNRQKYIKKGQLLIDIIGTRLAIQYKKCWQRMSGRAPGKTTGKSIMILNENGSNWNKIPYRDRSCGCGASMRTACIGLAFYNDIQKLVAISIQAGRITHHNPVAYLGGVISSYFTALAIQGIQPKYWIAYFLEKAHPLCKQYIIKSGREVKFNIQGQNWTKFIDSVQKYAQKRNLGKKIEEQKEPKFPEKYGIVERQHFYREVSWGGWPGALGIDSVLIAYDALLSSNGSWQQLCLRGILHGGDNDSTGSIAGAWFGALYGFKGVPQNHYLALEDINKLTNLGEKLFAQSQNN